jgi:hypothetical protein
MFIHKQCEMLSRVSNIEYHSPNNSSPAFNAMQLLNNPEIWKNHHGCFAPVRFYVDVPDIQEYDVILHLRDPRDVLVSMFYSYCYIHPGEVEVNTGYRSEIANQGIDQFVLDHALGRTSHYRGDYGTGGHVKHAIGGLKTRYENYVQKLLNQDNVIFLKYETMVQNYPLWIGQFIQPFPIENKQEVIDFLVSKQDVFFPKHKEEKMTHVRKITPGDHKEKLKSTTIKELNAIFQDTLTALAYET